MTRDEVVFRLPKQVERHLATLSKIYGREGDTRMQDILVNARVSVSGEPEYDSLDGGIYGHSLNLSLPEPLYLWVYREKDDIERIIEEGLNGLKLVPNEYISAVNLEMEVDIEQDWRRESGRLLPSLRIVPDDVTGRIWGNGGYRVFLSHKSEVKVETAELKKALQPFGVACFVAHEDIYPTKEWQSEIESALTTMDAFVALLTKGFHDSLWTDQEVGYALGRGVSVIALKLGKDPYGFIGKFQALSSTWETAPLGILNLLFQDERMVYAYIAALRSCTSWEDANRLAEALPLIQSASPTQIDALISAYNETEKVWDSWGFNGGWSSRYGPGIIPHLVKLTGKTYQLGPDKKVRWTP